MSQFTRNLKQTLTYWAPGTLNLYGKPTWSSPVQFKCRWEDKTQQLVNKHGEEFVSMTRAFVIETVDMDGYVFLGTSSAADPTVLAGAQEIQAVARQPDLRGLNQLTVIYLHGK